MLCDNCKRNEAKFHSVTIINGVRTERHLCAECHGGMSFSSVPGEVGVMPGFKEGAGFFTGVVPGKGTARRNAVCSVCGTGVREFLQSGYLGCDRCYRELSEAVLPVTQKVQGSTRHKGKTPRLYGAKPRVDPGIEYEKLSRELEAAIAAERYEDAIGIRDKMRALREGE